MPLVTSLYVMSTKYYFSQKYRDEYIYDVMLTSQQCLTVILSHFLGDFPYRYNHNFITGLPSHLNTGNFKFPSQKRGKQELFPLLHSNINYFFSIFIIKFAVQKKKNPYTEILYKRLFACFCLHPFP